MTKRSFRTCIPLIILAVASIAASAGTLNYEYDALGRLKEVRHPDDSVVSYTFDPAGNADDDARQHWFTLQGSLAGATDGRVTVPIYSTIGGRFDRLATRNTFRVGEATLTFTACDRATLDYRFDADEAAGAFRGRNGSFEIERLGGCAR